MSIAGLALRLLLVVALLVSATWAAHLVREALDMALPEKGQPLWWLLAGASLAYVVFLALPFVPGAEIGIAMLATFGAAVAPLVYAATVAALMLAYAAGRALPAEALARGLERLRLRRAAGLLRRAAPLTPDARLALLLEGAPPRLLALALRHRYVALALAVNVPGNSAIGGGGGILMMAGLSGIFTPVPTLVAILVAVAPIPLAVLLMGG